MILLRIAMLFGSLSLLAFGGGSGVLPDIQRGAVGAEHWLTAQQFIDLFAISRATPGPGGTVVLLVGLKAAGLLGALVAGVSMWGPPLLLVHGAARVWRRIERSVWRRRLEIALAPIAVGLTFGGGIALVRSTESGWVFWAITGAATLVLWLTEWHPALVLAAGAAMALLAHP